MDRFSTLIREWYRQNSRNLPWRNTKNPYCIWLSEIILQQTRVQNGLVYYLKFIKRFPTIYELAIADEDEVLNLWQGLGYYSRARNLHAAAKTIVEDFNGVFPSTYESIISLKGVGDYTASAVSSFAFNLPEAVVDGNVYRLLARYLGIYTPIDSGQGKKEFKKVASILLDKENPAEHNQAIMEVGALICKPKKPNCLACPLNSSCIAFQKSTFLELPVKEKKMKVRDRFFHYLIIQYNNHVFVKKRGPGDIWQGLYDFPVIEELKISKKPILNKEFENLKLLKEDGFFKHLLSHQKIHARFWICETLDNDELSKDYELLNVNELSLYPMPQLLIRYLESSSLFKAD